MSGLKSRRKGMRNEYLLRDYFRSLGWKSDRVPSSGAAQGFKGDVTLSKDGKTLTAELKVRQNEFRSIYALYQFYTSGGPLRLLLTKSNGTTLESTKTALVTNNFDYTSVINYPLYDEHVTLVTKEYSQALKKLFGLEKFVKSCDFLVIKIDHKPFLFIRYL